MDNYSSHFHENHNLLYLIRFFLSFSRNFSLFVKVYRGSRPICVGATTKLRLMVSRRTGLLLQNMCSFPSARSKRTIFLCPYRFSTLKKFSISSPVMDQSSSLLILASLPHLNIRRLAKANSSS